MIYDPIGHLQCACDQFGRSPFTWIFEQIDGLALGENGHSSCYLHGRREKSSVRKRDDASFAAMQASTRQRNHHRRQIRLSLTITSTARQRPALVNATRPQPPLGRRELDNIYQFSA